MMTTPLTGPEVAPEAAEDEQLADRLVRDEPALLSALGFGSGVQQGVGPGPSLLIGDQVGIALYTPEMVGFNDHRMALLAMPGDIVVVRRRVPEFERYLETVLGIRSVTYLQADTGNPLPVSRQCQVDPQLRGPITERLEKAGSLTIQAYLTTGNEWRLAQDLAAQGQGGIWIAGPSPRISRRANDKLWFWALARQVAGRDAVPPTQMVFGPAAAAARVAHLARTADQVVVKVPDSAGAAGNFRIEAAMLRGRHLSDIRDLLMQRLAAAGWTGTYPILVGVWESGVIGSPSAQMWLPHVSEGPPRLLGLFEQRIEDAAGAFVGAARASLDRSITEEMSTEAIRIGAVLQRLGYFGPCSLDAVLRVAASGQTELHWIECNGRWSGVSIPLAATRRFLRGEAPKGIVVAHGGQLPGAVSDVDSLCRRLGDLLFRPGTSREGILIASPPQPGRQSIFDAVAMADNQARAEHLLEKAWRRLGA